MRVRTGNKAHARYRWNGKPASAYLDTSWDGRGTSVLVLDEDIVRWIPGTPEELGLLVVRDEANVRDEFPRSRGNSGLGYTGDVIEIA